jgi:hypothetical protein
MEPKQLIYERMSAVMADIGAIGKNKKNEAQGYKFRGIDDLYNAVNAALAKHKVFMLPTVMEQTREERQTKSGGNLIYTILKISYKFYTEDGSTVETVLIGEAMDSGDKSCNKAMSAAQKYALLQAFCIPTEEPKDTEEETHEVAPRQDNAPTDEQKMHYNHYLSDIKDAKDVKKDLLAIHNEALTAVKKGEITKAQQMDIVALLSQKKEELKANG